MVYIITSGLHYNIERQVMYIRMT